MDVLTSWFSCLQRPHSPVPSTPAAPQGADFASRLGPCPVTPNSPPPAPGILSARAICTDFENIPWMQLSENHLLGAATLKKHHLQTLQQPGFVKSMQTAPWGSARPLHSCSPCQNPACPPLSPTTSCPRPRSSHVAFPQEAKAQGDGDAGASPQTLSTKVSSQQAPPHPRDELCKQPLQPSWEQ